MKIEKCKTLRQLFGPGNVRRWGKGYYENGGRLCLMGAISKVVPSSRHSNVIDRLSKSIYNLFPKRASGYGNGITSFNDWPRTTYKDLRKVINHAKV